MEFFGDHRGLIIALGILGFLASGGFILWRLVFNPAPGTSALTPRTPVPSTRPAHSRPPSNAAGQAEYVHRGQAKTIKVAPPAKDAKNTTTQLVAKLAPAASDAEARDSLFSGLSSSPDGQFTDSNQKAERMEELNLHPAPNRIEAKPDPEAAPLPGAVPPPPRSQTAELDDILSRIDKVLAENPVMATSTITPESATEAQKAKVAKTEAVANPTPAAGDQQKLF
jgi:hypothetical protein